MRLAWRVMAIGLVAALAGCGQSRLQELERENARLETSLKKATQSLGQAQAQKAGQVEAYRQCLEKYMQATARAADLETRLVELEKQLGVCRQRLGRTEGPLPTQPTTAASTQPSM